MGVINLFGASGHAKVIMDIIEAQGDEVRCLYDDAPHCAEIHNKPVYKSSEISYNQPLIISIGSNKSRKAVAEALNAIYGIAIHPASIISPSTNIGKGSVIMPGVIIQPDVKIGKHNIINTGATIDHECILSDYVHVSPHATLCGNVRVGEGSWIGAGATVIQGIKIGKWCIIGAGATVIRDIPDYAVVAGTPAKEIKYNPK